MNGGGGGTVRNRSTPHGQHHEGEGEQCWTIQNGQMPFSTCQLSHTLPQQPAEQVPLLLHLTGLYFLGSKSAYLKALKIMLAIALNLLVLHQTVWMLAAALLDDHFNAQMAHTMINFNWMLQAQISMAFLLFWQAKGHLPGLFGVMRQFRGYSHLWMHKFATISYAALFLLDLAVVGLILVLFVAMGRDEQEKPSEENRTIQVIQVYGTTLLHDKLFIAVHYYTRFVWLVVLVLFISAASGIYFLIKQANERLRSLGAHEPEDVAAFGDALNVQLMEHTELARWIRSVDRVFGIYTFLMVCLNIPVFIFSLSMLLLTLPHSPNWVHVMVPSVDILFSLCELIGLTIIPAKIHTRIHEVEKIIFDNVYIWKNLNTRIYQLANAFIMYANQPSLGITLWGFAVIRKPLILTTISLTATYLTVIIQFNSVGGNDACSNATAKH